MTDQEGTNVRRWTMASGEGRLDSNGVEWFACDPYPYWYRWEGDRLIQRGIVDESIWPDDGGLMMIDQDLGGDNDPYEDPLNPGLLIRDYCSCEGEDHDYDCEQLDEPNRCLGCGAEWFGGEYDDIRCHCPLGSEPEFTGPDYGQT